MVYKALDNEANTAYGFIWRKYESNSPDKIKITNKTKTNSRKVDQLSLDEKYIKTYVSTAEAARNVGVSRETVVVALRNPNRTAGGYKWKKHSN